MAALTRALVVVVSLSVGDAMKVRASEQKRPHYVIPSPDGKLESEAEALNLALWNASDCVPLENRGSHYTIRVYVGTPPQKMDLLADTGSDAVVINSCQCRDTKACDLREKCFSPHRSSSFIANHKFKGHATKATMTFGSGTIESRVGSDIVHVGNISAQLTDGLFMLVNRALNIQGPFEGILGLGPPHEKFPNGTNGTNSTNGSRGFDPYGFAEAAGIERFSICLNRGGGGLLRLGAAPFPKQLGSMAKAHWGLSFLGMSVSNWHLTGFCSAPPEPGQQAACGALPDSGTTLITGPKSHLMVLFSHLCDHWPRCNDTFQNNTYKTPNKWFHFERLLYDCHDWAGLPGKELNATQINEELPSVRFTLAGQGGERQQLKLTGEDYLVHMKSATHLATSPRWLGGKAFPYQGLERKICSPAFHPMNVTSANMGPIWILGLPVLHKYQANYDRSTRPPAMSFSSTPCGSCGEVRLAQGQLGGSASRSTPRSQGLLWLDEPPRVSPFAAQGL